MLDQVSRHLLPEGRRGAEDLRRGRARVAAARPARGDPRGRSAVAAAPLEIASGIDAFLRHAARRARTLAAHASRPTAATSRARGLSRRGRACATCTASRREHVAGFAAALDAARARRAQPRARARGDAALRCASPARRGVSRRSAPRRARRRACERRLPRVLRPEETAALIEAAGQGEGPLGAARPRHARGALRRGSARVGAGGAAALRARAPRRLAARARQGPQGAPRSARRARARGARRATSRRPAAARARGAPRARGASSSSRRGARDDAPELLRAAARARAARGHARASASRRTCCATRSRPTCSRAARICAPCRRCSATPISRPRRSTRT